MSQFMTSTRFWFQKRVYSGMSAIIDFQIVNLRAHDCSKESRNTNCQIVELFLTVDTSRKMQNGVNIHVSIDRSVYLFSVWLQLYLSIGESTLWKMMLPPFWIKYSIWNFDQNAIRLCHQGRINKFELILSIIELMKFNDF